jgi:hypothetical protein
MLPQVAVLASRFFNEQMDRIARFFGFFSKDAAYAAFGYCVHPMYSPIVKILM